MPNKLAAALLFLLILLGSRPNELRAQLPSGLFLEARAGYSLPMFDDDLAVEAEAGPAFAIGGRVDAIPMVGIFAGYHQMRFGCAGCAERDLDETIVVHGAEGGVHVDLPTRLLVQPWLRGGLTYQTLRFSSGSDRMSSSQEVGFTLSGGISLDIVRRVRVAPGIRYLSAPANFDFSFAPAVSTNAAGLAIEVGVAVEL